MKKDLKKIPGLMIGMGPLIPTGMLLTRPSDIKNQEKVAIEKADQLKKVAEEREKELKE